MPELMTKAPAELGKPACRCTGQAIAAIAARSSKTMPRPGAIHPVAHAVWQGLLLFPLVAGCLGLILFGLLPILVVALVLFLPAVLPLLMVCVGVLTTETDSAGDADRLPYAEGI
jgi:hypothetical protein